MTGEKKVKLLLTKHPLDGHESGYNMLARGLRKQRIEVILGGPQLADEIVETAIQEDVDFIGYRIMAGGPIYLVQKLNATLGCYGCREATDLADSETVLGFPASQLDKIVASLEKLNEKAIPRVRGKTVYKALLERDPK